MINQLLQALALGAACGIIGGVYHGILRYKPPFNKLSLFFARHEGKGWAEPLWFCLPCISGQLGLWAYLILKAFPALSRHGAGVNTFQVLLGLFCLIVSICTSILTASFINNKIKFQ